MEFCNEFFIDFNAVIYSKLIKDAIAYGSKNDMVDIPFISINRKELRWIKSLELDEVSKRLVFTLLVFKKLNNIIYGADYINETFSSIRLKSNMGRMDVLYKKLKILEDAGIIRVTIMSKIEWLIPSMNHKKTAINVRDYRNIGNYYLHVMGFKRFFECEVCGTSTERKSGNQRFCTECGIKYAVK